MPVTARLLPLQVNADDTYLNDIVSTMKPTMLQLHGNESTARVTELKTRYGVPVMKAFAVRDEADLVRAKTYERVADMLLLDAKTAQKVPTFQVAMVSVLIGPCSTE